MQREDLAEELSLEERRKELVRVERFGGRGRDEGDGGPLGQFTLQHKQQLTDHTHAHIEHEIPPCEFVITRGTPGHRAACSHEKLAPTARQH